MKQVSKIILSASFAAALLVGCGGGGSADPLADVQDVAKNFKGVWVEDSNTSDVKGCDNLSFSDGESESVFHTMTIDASKMVYNTVKYSELDCPSDSVDTNYTQTYNYKIDPTKQATTKSGTKIYAMDLDYTTFSMSKGTVTDSHLLQTGKKYYIAIGKNSTNLLLLDGDTNMTKRDKFLENNVSQLNDSDEDILRLIKK